LSSSMYRSDRFEILDMMFPSGGVLQRASQVRVPKLAGTASRSL
jgi:hypothetical protein